jgi:WD40 repeat protein
MARTSIELALATAVLVAAPFLVAQLYSAATEGPIAQAAAPGKSKDLVRSAYRVARTDWVLLSKQGETVELVNAASGDVAASWQIPESLIISLSATSDGSKLLATISGGKLIYCNLTEGTNPSWLSIPGRQLVSQALLDPMGERACLLRETAEGDVVESVLVGNDWEMDQQTITFDRSLGTSRIALSPCGQWLLGHNGDGHWFVWDAETGAIAQQGQHPALATGLSLEWWPDGRGFFAGDCNGFVRSFSRLSNQVMWETNCGASAVGKLSITNSQTGLFNVVVATITGETLVLDSHSGRVLNSLITTNVIIRLIHDCAVSNSLMTIDASGTFRDWDKSTGRLIRERV